MASLSGSMSANCNHALSTARSTHHTKRQDLKFSGTLRPNAGHGLLVLEVSRSHTTTHHSRYDSPGRVISPSQRPLPDNTQHKQTCPRRDSNPNPSRRAAADPRLRPRGHWNRQDLILLDIKATPTPGVRTVTRIHRYHYGRKTKPVSMVAPSNRIMFVQSLTVRPVV